MVADHNELDLYLPEQGQGRVSLGRILLPLALALAVPAAAWADDPQTVVLKDHVFQPAEIHVKANTRTQLLVKNQDSTAEEFDSTDLRVEKVIAGGREGTVRLPALAPGRYNFIGEFHADTAKGVVIAE